MKNSPKTKMKDSILGWFNALLLSWGVFALALLIAMSQTWVYPHFASEMLNEHNLSEETIEGNYKTLIRYNLDPRKEVLEFQELGISEKGKIHFEEVKLIFKAVLLTGLISLTAAALLGTYLTQIKKDSRYMLRAFRLSLTLILAGGAAAALFFEDVFVIFHKLLFSNDYWIFDRSRDPIIDYLPESFFRNFAIFIGGIWMLILAVLRFVFYPYHRIREQNLRREIK